MIITGQQASHLFVDASARLGGHYRHELGHKIIGALREDGQPLAYAVFTGVGPHKAELTVWSSGQHGGGGRAFLQAVFGTVFTQWGCARLSAFIRVSNKKSRRAAEALGFRPETMLLRWFGTEDAVVYCMFKEHCRWIGKE